MDIRRDNESVAENGAGLNTVDVFKMALPQDKVSTLAQKDLPSTGTLDFTPLDAGSPRGFGPGGCVIRPDRSSKHDKSDSDDGIVIIPSSLKPEIKTTPELGGNIILKDPPSESKPDSRKDRGSDLEILPQDRRSEKWNPKKVSTDAAISLGRRFVPEAWAELDTE